MKAFRKKIVNTFYYLFDVQERIYSIPAVKNNKNALYKAIFLR